MNDEMFKFCRNNEEATTTATPTTPAGLEGGATATGVPAGTEVQGQGAPPVQPHPTPGAPPPENPKLRSRRSAQPAPPA